MADWTSKYLWKLKTTRAGTMNDFTPSFTLFARPSLIEGVARVMDFGGVLDEYNSSPTPLEADALAIRSDWIAVGNDVKAAIAILASNRPDVQEAQTDLAGR